MARLFIGALLFVSGVYDPSLLLVIIGLGLLASFGWTVYRTHQDNRELPAFPMPPAMRATAEAMARPIDPTPKRVLPPDEKMLSVAQVATTPEALARLMADKPPAWPWAVFASVMVQRRNGVQDRLRVVTSGYQPEPGHSPLTALQYCAVAHHTTSAVVDLLYQIEQFMPSPAFKGAFGGDEGDDSADAEAIASVANRLMDYHESFLGLAEYALQTPVQRDVIVFAADTGLFALCPLVGYERFIVDMCARIGQAQDLLPHTGPETVIALEDVVLTMDAPDGLGDRIATHIRRAMD